MNIPITYGSVCSGIEAASQAWHSLDWQPLWFAEIEPFPCAVLAQRWPEVPNHGDMTLLAEKILRGDIPTPDVLVGGTPCQSFSPSGNGEGLADPRGQLTLAYCDLIEAIDLKRKEMGNEPVIVIWENSKGVLNKEGDPFGQILGRFAGEDFPLSPAGGKWTSAGCVHGSKRAVAWRVKLIRY